MFELGNLNYLAIIVATLTNVALGSWWYSPAGMGKKWSKMTGVDMMKSPKQETQRAIMAVFVGAIVQAVVLAVVIKSLSASTALEGFKVGLVLWAGFVAATSIGDALYSRRGWGFWWLNASFFLIVMLVNSIIFSVWK
jgi:hypothetical protein